MQNPYFHPAWIEVDLIQFKKNIDALKSYLTSSKLCIPVKANAYGHGLIPMGLAAERLGVDYLAVSCLQEGVLLRKANIKIPIVVLGAIHEEQIPDLIQYDLEFTIASQFKAQLVEKEAKRIQRKCKIHIEVETGMQRTGLRCETAESLIENLHSSDSFQIVGIYSHMATADTPNSPIAEKQIKLFTDFIKKIRSKYSFSFLAHLANSGGICYYPESHLDMVRTGILAYGYFHKQSQPPLNTIAPFFSLKAKVAYFKVVAANSGISYDHIYKTTEQTRVVTIPVGYGDGYRRSLSNKGDIILRGQKYKIAGRVCMDQFMVDIGNQEGYVGDEVVLIGKQGNAEITVQEIANLCDTIPYETLCSFNERIPRIYLDENTGENKHA